MTESTGTFDRESVFALLEDAFDFVMVLDDQEQIVRANGMLRRACGQEDEVLEGRPLRKVVDASSLLSFRAAVNHVANHRGTRTAAYRPAHQGVLSLPLKVTRLGNGSHPMFVCVGSQGEALSHLTDWEKEERVKELACLYAVAEWIEASPTIDLFFERLPDFLGPGMRYPDETLVWIGYDGQEYGIRPPGDNVIAARIRVNDEVKGEIRVGYRQGEYQMLSEEQKMLNEIVRMLNVALERRELTDRLTDKQSQQQEYAERLEALEAEIEERTRELEQQRDRLRMVDSYLERVNQGWEESKNWLQTIFKAIPDTVALIDRHRQVVLTNQDHIEPGGKCHQVFFDRDTPCKDCRLARIVRDKTPITLTLRHEDRYLEVHALPIYNQEHEVDGIMEFYRDVTLEKTYEKQLRQADRLASLGQLVSGIGHEINNPNQFIRGNIKIIKQALEDMLPIVDAYQAEHPDLRIARLPYAFFREHIMTLVDDMAHGSERIKGIVEGLKRFARRDEGQLIDKIDINTLIQACARLVHNEVHKHAEIELDLDPAAPTFVGNSQKIEQVMVNLIVNASQAMPDDHKGHITVSTRAEGDDLIVAVADDGKGMNEKTLKQIFDPFFTTKRAKGGTGLGLAIAYRIIEEHGGRIEVSSRIDEGTTFHITIPTGAGASAVAAGQSQPGADR